MSQSLCPTFAFKSRTSEEGQRQAECPASHCWGEANAPGRDAIRVQHGSARLRPDTLASVPKAQNGQKHNSDMLFKLSEKLRDKSKPTHHVPDFVFLPTKPPSPNPLCFGNWKSKNSNQEKIQCLSSNISTGKLSNVNESIQMTIRKCSTSQGDCWSSQGISLQKTVGENALQTKRSNLNVICTAVDTLPTGLKSTTSLLYPYFLTQGWTRARGGC